MKNKNEAPRSPPRAGNKIMDLDLLQKLKKWRIDTAQKQGVELFRILPNKVLETIALIKPKTKDNLLAIKGIREKKFEKYGADLLALINGDAEEENIADIENGVKLYTVSGFLGLLNNNLKALRARIQGEVSSLDIRGNYLFFTLKDKDNENVLNCFMWGSNYQLCGIALEEGMEVIIEGFPEVYEKTGRLAVQVFTIELVGEGALKKAYEELKKKLEKEGLFAKGRKRMIPDFPRKIGLITSETGAVIHDFLNNLGKYGYHIKFMDSRVEGQIAIRDLIFAIDYFNRQDIDVLVIIRGGGSLESLQAFNNEALMRKISECSMPVICGIGHDKDVSLASLVADAAVSTPTAVANYLNRTWDGAVKNLMILERDILYKYQELLRGEKYRLEELAGGLRKYFGLIFQKFDDLKHRLKNALADINYKIKDGIRILDNSIILLFRSFKKTIKGTSDFLDKAERRLKISDPARQLKLGYSIVSFGGKVIKSIKQAKVGDAVDIRVCDGKIKSTINNINSLT